MTKTELKLFIASDLCTLLKREGLSDTHEYLYLYADVLAAIAQAIHRDLRRVESRYCSQEKLLTKRPLK